MELFKSADDDDRCSVRKIGIDWKYGKSAGSGHILLTRCQVHIFHEKDGRFVTEKSTMSQAACLFLIEIGNRYGVNSKYSE